MRAKVQIRASLEVHWERIWKSLVSKQFSELWGINQSIHSSWKKVEVENQNCLFLFSFFIGTERAEFNHLSLYQILDELMDIYIILLGRASVFCVLLFKRISWFIFSYFTTFTLCYMLITFLVLLPLLICTCDFFFVYWHFINQHVTIFLPWIKALPLVVEPV